MSANHLASNDFDHPYMDHRSAQAAAAGFSTPVSQAWTVSLGAGGAIADHSTERRVTPPFCFAGGAS
ncbi:MAG: hypothetical protein AAGJ52_10530 [Pseudomonadota bacterium]